MPRKAGSRNLGYYYRAGRGWYAQSGGKAVPLRDKDGEPGRRKATPISELKEARTRMMPAQSRPVNGVTVHEVCSAYFEKVKADGSLKTFIDRRATLFDFCTGLPPKFQKKDNVPQSGDHIHRGYGETSVTELRPIDVHHWLGAHKAWNGGKRSRIQAHSTTV